ncbi:hypothetical protein [Arthrobacter castelli]|uniref:hypothetical protein n=1 Tax=Arthrobacter castelli TaxID=271431 RepID=UPI0004124180|nr:hypothetical protein [Arthrobacter castelli]
MPENIEHTAVITVTLPVSLDGNTWYPIVFEAESADYLDSQIQTWIITHRDQLIIGDENTDYSRLPKTCQALLSPVYEHA